MIVAIFIALDRLGFALVIKNPKRLVALSKKTLFLTHAASPAWVGEEGFGVMGETLLCILAPDPM